MINKILAGLIAAPLLATVSHASEVFIPTSPSGEPGLHFGSEASGETGFGIHTGEENRLKAYVQDMLGAQLDANGVLSAQTFNTDGGITIADDSVYSIDKDDAGVEFDSNGMLVVITSATQTTGIVGFRLQSGSNGEIFVLVQPSTTLAVSAVSSAPTGTTGTNGKFTISVQKNTQQIHFENRRGASVSLSYMFIGGGVGVQQ